MTRSGSRVGWFILSGLLVALVLAGVVSNFASSHPDGLDSATLEGCTLDDEGNIIGGTCAAQGAEEHELSDSPFADYGIRGLDNDFLGTGLSGVVGVLLTFAVGLLVFWLVRNRRAAATEPASGGAGEDGSGRAQSGTAAERSAPGDG